MLLVELKIHKKRVHEGEKRYECKHCGKKFFTSHGLKLHTVGVHEMAGVPKEKTHLCHLCGKSFAQSGNLWEHKNRVHLKVVRYTCHFCGMNFFHRNDVRKHFRSHVNKNEVEGMECDEFLKISKLPENVGGDDNDDNKE